MDVERRILLLEDDPSDAGLIERQLQDGGLSCVLHWVEDEESFRRELKEFEPDVILADYSLPSFSGADALDVVLGEGIDTPFIFVSGTLGEEAAVAALQHGAADYVLKDRLARLVPAITSALHHAESERDRRALEAQIAEHQRRLSELLEHAPIGFVSVDAELRITYVNVAAQHVLQLDIEQVVGRGMWQVFPDLVDSELAGRLVALFHEGVPVDYELFYPSPGIWVRGLAFPSEGGFSTFFLDITEQKRLEADTRRLASFPEENPNVVIEIDDAGSVSYVNPATRTRFPDVARAGRAHPLLAGLPAEEGGVRPATGTFECPVDDSVFLLNVAAVPGSTSRRIYGMDITKQRRAEEALRRREAEYRELVNQIPAIVYRAEVGIDGRWLFVSPQIEAMFGLRADDVMADPRLVWTNIHPDDQQRVLQAEEMAQRPEPFSLEYRFVRSDGRVVWVRDEGEVVADPDGSGLLTFGLIFDVTDRRLAEDDLQRTMDDLRRVNDQRRHLLVSLVNAQEEERQRIANDIHDDSIQVMTAIGMRLSILRKEVPETADLKSFLQAEETVRLAIQRLRHLLFELHPPALDQSGLAAALRDHIGLWEEEPEHPRCELENHLAVEPPPEPRAIVYRIAIEALANIRKHAHAQTVHVVLEAEGDGVRSTIRDDGVGFDVGVTAVLPAHVGLASMHERAQLAGGWCRVESAPGAGTTVVFWIPTTVSTAS